MQGQIIKGRYRIDKVIGRGGMAVVYTAFDSILGRHVAIKILNHQFTHNTHFIERFRREAHAAANLVHPNITTIYDTGHSDDIHYIVMEYVGGKTLKQMIEQKAPLPISESIDIAKQIAEALDHAHNRGIIHRDIKPQNILINEDGIAKVTDFGIARALAMPSLTQTGKVLGTARYISPEQAKGRQADQRSDIYSLGVIFYEMVTGRVPFEGSNSVDVAEKHIVEKPRNPREFNSDISVALEIIIDKLLKKNPDDRYQGVKKLIDDLSSWESPEKKALLASDMVAKSRTELRKHKERKKPAQNEGRTSRNLATERKSDRKKRANSTKRGSRKNSSLMKRAFIVTSIIATMGLALYFYSSTGVSPEENVRRYDGGEIKQSDYAGEKVVSLVPVEVVDYDPDGDGDENPAKVGNIFDSSQSTAWSTEYYRSAAFDGQKSGVGVYMDYGKNVILKEIAVISSGGWAGAIKGSNDILNWETLKEIGSADKKISINITAKPYRYYLIWIDELSRASGHKYRCKIYDAKTRGRTF